MANTVARGKGSMFYQSDKWIKSDMVRTKINVDAAIFTNFGAVSAVLRNWNGLFLGGYVIPVRN